uniref:Putative scarecrow-like protein 9 n=1 Tax=Davidia involucrata TaxID=16924 RepID=A0A5B7A4N9_DAVIN
MDALVQGYSGSANGFDFRKHSIPALADENHVNGGYKPNHTFTDVPRLSSRPPPAGDISPSSGRSSEDSSPEDSDFSDASLKYISQMLMEEDMENRTCMFQDCLALQAAERSFYDVLVEKYPPSPNQHPLFIADENTRSPDDDSSRTWSSHSSTAVNNFAESNWIHHQGDFESSFGQSSPTHYSFESILQPFGSSNGFCDAVDGSMDSLVSPFQVTDSYGESQPILQSRGREGGGKVTQLLPNNNYEKPSRENSRREHSPNGSKGKKNHHREDSDCVEEEGRSSKQLANNIYDEESEVFKMFDEVLLCPGLGPGLCDESALRPFDEALSSRKFQQKPKVGRPRKNQGKRKEVVDLRSLLTQCAQAVSGGDSRTMNELLKRIRQHSSPHGDGGERSAHYFADALEARLSGTGTSLYTASKSRRISAANLLKAYQVYVLACPFNKMSNFFATRTIRKLAMNATRLHIIDFGILYGFQWPCLIQRLSVRPGGPPRLRITGIELPHPGFRPAERVEETGRRLANYCERFGVPFEYNAIAKKWDTIQLEDLKIDGNHDEVLVVNCLYRLRNVPDETVVVNSPRDAVLNLIKRINPDLFIHGVLNGTYNAPFFVTRFREALFHFSALFDMFEANALREDQDRMLYEKEVFGRDIMNVIACEGTERVERPETYKQWQVRNVRAGFRQLPLNQEDVKDVRSKVKLGYHKDFVVDEDSNWMLQGWKGRIISALSCWKPSQD